MKKVTLIAPCQNPQQLQHLSMLEDQLISIAGGYSLYSGTGAWKDDSGKLYREHHQRYEVLVESWSGKDIQVVDALKWWGKLAGEDSVCYSIEEVEANIESVRVPAFEKVV